MVKKKKIFHLLGHGGYSSKLNIFSGLRHEEASVFSNTPLHSNPDNDSAPSHSQDNDIYQQLLDKGYSKQSIHKVLHHLVLEDIRQQRLYEQKSLAGKTVWHIKRFFQQYKLLRFLKNITAKGLFLLKTQWAKKPKNPI